MFDFVAEQLLADREREIRTFLLAREAARYHGPVRSDLRARLASGLARVAVSVHREAAARVALRSGTDTA